MIQLAETDDELVCTSCGKPPTIEPGWVMKIEEGRGLVARLCPACNDKESTS